MVTVTETFSAYMAGTPAAGALVGTEPVLVLQGGLAKQVPVSGLLGNVIGPVSSTDQDLAAWSGTTGKLLQDLSYTTVTSKLNVFTSGLQGLVPASGGSAANFLNASGTWTPPLPAGSNTQVQFNNAGFFGADAGMTYAGSGQFTLALGTLTSTNPKALNVTGTWNAPTVTTTGASGTGTVATLTFATQASAYPVNSTITVNGVTPTGYNGTYQVTASTTTSVSYNSPTTGAQTGAGTIVAQLFDAPIFTNVVNTSSNNNSALLDIQSGGLTQLLLQPNYPQPAAFAGQKNTEVPSVTLSLGNGTNTQGSPLGGKCGMFIYNYVDNILAPQNFQRLSISWTTFDSIHLSTQSQGTGLPTNDMAFFFTAATVINDSGATTGPSGYFTFSQGGNANSANFGYAIMTMFLNSGQFDIPGQSMFGWHQGNFAASGAVSCAVGELTTGTNGLGGVLYIGNDNTHVANGWYNWGGQKRTTSDMTINSGNTGSTLTNVPGLSVTLHGNTGHSDARTYFFESELYVTVGTTNVGGVQAAIAGTATATAITYTGYTIADNAIKGKANSAALGGSVGSTTTTELTGIIVRITGIITVNASGTLTVQAAQSASNAANTTIKTGSWFYVYDTP